MSNVVYAKFGEHRGTRRIWLEGERLARQGIAPGARFRVEIVPGRVSLLFAQEGDRVVSAKRRGDRARPVIDVNRAEVAAALGNGERVRVVIRPNRIDITPHHIDVARDRREARLRGKLSAGEALDVGTLAHGAGILDHALHEGLDDAGVPARLAFAVEIEPAYLDTSERNNPLWDARSIAIEGDMLEVEADKLPALDVLVAGLPCTGASLSGRAKNRLTAAEEHPTAGALFVAFLRIVEACNPAVVLLENVPQYQTTASMAVIRAVLVHRGYRIEETILDGNALGALEARQRLCMVAVSSGLPSIPLDGLEPIRRREATLAEVLEDVPEDSPRWKAFAYLDAKETRDKAAGKGFARQVLDADAESCGTIGAGYAKCRSTEPFLRNPRTGLQRILTPREHAAVKGIPFALVEGESETRQHEMLGQSVIHPAFRAVGRRIGAVLRELRVTPAQAQAV